jgi:hypothetical protein
MSSRTTSWAGTASKSCGRGKGKGPLEKMIIRRVPAERRVVFVDAPSDVLVDIDVRLGIR